MARLILSVELDSEARIGAGDIRLLELVEKTGSISAAARAHGITFRRAWTVLDELNRAFKTSVIATRSGGLDGGGARLTDFGREVAARYRAIEAIAAHGTERDLATLEAAVSPKAAVARRA
jgi:molybdate transport system regulatory protein